MTRTLTELKLLGYGSLTTSPGHDNWSGPGKNDAIVTMIRPTLIGPTGQNALGTRLESGERVSPG